MSPRKNDQPLRERITNHLATLNIPLTNQQLDELLATAEKSHLSHLELLERLLSIPANLRRERGVERRIRLARFRDPATFETFDWTFNGGTIRRSHFEELGTGQFVARRDHLVFAGQSGLGKSGSLWVFSNRFGGSIMEPCCMVGTPLDDSFWVF